MDTLQKLARDIARALPGLTLCEEEPMSRHTSFKIGGAAAAFALPKSTDELKELLVLLGNAGEDPLIIGNGTNLLVTDRTLRRFVVKLGENFSGLERAEGSVIRAEAGVPLSRLAAFAHSHGLCGLEFAHGIPGTVGGAVVMNAGAYGGEIKDAAIFSEYICSDGRSGRLTGEEQCFSYRHSAYSNSDKIITCACFALTEGSRDEIRIKMEDLARKRRASQPLESPSAGSAFKRPAGGYAAELIDKAGLKGFSLGGAGVSEKHAGFIINKGGATFDDVLSLISYIQEKVYTMSGIMLEPEIKIIQNR